MRRARTAAIILALLLGSWFSWQFLRREIRPGQLTERSAGVNSVLRTHSPSASEGQQKTVADTLRVIRAYGDSATFANIVGIHQLGQYVVAADAGMDLRLAVFGRSSGRLLSRLGRVGSGPTEFRAPRWMFPDLEARNRLWVYDFSNRRFSLLALDAPDDKWVVREIPLNLGVSLERPVFHGRSIITNGLLGDYALLSVDTATGQRREYGHDVPFDSRRIAHRTGRRLLNRSFTAVDPALARIAVAFQWDSRVDFYTADGQRYASIRGPVQTKASFRVEDSKFFWNDDGEMAYADAAGGEEYVYLLFFGERETNQRQLPTRVHVFTWSGEFIKELILPVQAYPIAVSDDERSLFIGTTDPYPQVLELELGAALESLQTENASVRK